MKIIQSKINLLRAKCKKHSVEKLYLVGSAAKNNMDEKSDIDFLVRFGEIDLLNYFDNYMEFKESLEEMYDRKIDLIEEQALSNPIFINSINRDKVLIYEGRANSEVAV